MLHSDTSGMRTLVVGLDGVCLSVLEPLFDDNELPALESLYERSASGPLESQLPPWTPSAWPSLYTGKNPGKHGVYDFLHFDGYDWDVVNRSHVKATAVWELLSMNGFESVVLNVPVTHPSPAFDGTLVPGYISPESPECHPESTLSELRDQLGEYRVYMENSGTNTSKAERVNGYETLIGMRGAAFRYLVDDREPDFGFVQFQQCDTVFHEYPDDTETVRRVFRAIDTELSKILETCDPDITLIVSDHGIGPMEGKELRVNQFLREQGLVTTTAGDGGMPSWASLSRNQLRNGQKSESTPTPSPAERALEYAAAVGITSQRIGTILQRLGLDDFVLEYVSQDIVRAGTERVDFADSTAYMRSRTEMGVRLNVAGREPDGVVDPDEYEAVRSDVMAALDSVETPDGEPFFEQVVPREAVFDGPYLEDAPDILTVPADFTHYLSASLRSERFAEPSEPWEHKRNGIVMVAGDEIDPDTDLTGSHLFDITPTILATFGLGVGSEMDGTSLPVVPETGRTEYPAFEPEPAVETDETAVEQRLADLGYLE